MKRIGIALLLCFSVCLGAAPVEVYFSPEGQVKQKLIHYIDQESRSVKAAVYCLMDGEIARALDRAQKRGVSVEVIVDSFSVKARSPLKRMADKGISLFVWDPEEEPSSSKKGLMHDKFCIFGDKTVWTGSFNFTRQASLVNRENVLVVHDPAIAELYLKEFQKIKHAGCRPYRQFLERREVAKQH